MTRDKGASCRILSSVKRGRSLRGRDFTYVLRDGACGGPLKRDALLIRGDDLSGKVL